MSESTHRASFASAVTYKDPMWALKWLEDAFGFETSLLLTDADGNMAHSEMSYGNGYIMVANEWTENIKSPRELGGANTQIIHVQLDEDVDAHFERAKAAGATVLEEPNNQFYGDRTYRVVDPEGHIWSFAQTIEVTSPSDWEATSGLKVKTSL